MSAVRPGQPGATRACPHCKETILESAAVCPACKHHVRFDAAPEAPEADIPSPLRIAESQVSSARQVFQSHRLVRMGQATLS